MSDMGNQNLITWADLEQSVEETIKLIQSDSYETIQRKLERLAAVLEQGLEMDLFQEEPDTPYSLRRTRQLLSSLIGSIGDRLIQLGVPETAEFRATAERVIKSFDLLSLRLTNLGLGLERFEALPESSLVN